MPPSPWCCNEICDSSPSLSHLLIIISLGIDSVFNLLKVNLPSLPLSLPFGLCFLSLFAEQLWRHVCVCVSLWLTVLIPPSFFSVRLSSPLSLVVNLHHFASLRAEAFLLWEGVKVGVSHCWSWSVFPVGWLSEYFINVHCAHWENLFRLLDG